MSRARALLYGWLSRRFMAGCSNYNPLEVRRSSRSKRQAREMFERLGVPHARGTTFTNPATAQRFAREHGFPLVVKPNVSGFSRGSHFPIENANALWKASLAVKVWWPTSIVEQYLLGANYRVLATPDEIVSIIRRYPPFVDGNGRDSIDRLIDAENATRRAMGLLPTIHPIEKSAAVLRYLRRQGLDFDTVPADGERVFLFNRVALAPGGVVETIDASTVPVANLDLCRRIVDAFGANLFGIDVIFESGIETDYREQRCIFLEVNSRPYTRMHYFPRYGAADDAALDDFHRRMDRLQIADADVF